MRRPFLRRPLDVRSLAFILTLLAVLGFHAAASATPALTMDVATGEVLYQEDATQQWFPASTTKLMTVYVALSAVRDHQIAMDTPLVVSARAHKMPPSKMGFAPGTQVTLENALKMLMVRSANDVAITVAEGVAGSVEAFADDMNQAAAQLGMRDSHFVNPNGLPDPDHVSSARDLAILARALYTQFPEQAGLFNLGELAFGSELIPNHNNLLGRYPGADGMKTGFTCAAGFNVVASAYRDGRRIVVVVLGAPTVKARTEKVAALFDRGFAGVDRPIASVTALPSAGGGGAPDMHNQVCRAGRNALIARFNAQVEQLDAPLSGQPAGGGIGLTALNPEKTFLFGAAATAPGAAPVAGPTAERISLMPQPVFDPVPVHVGAEPGYAGVVAQARAPHTPIGSDTPPVTAEAYAAPPAAARGIGGSPLEVDPTALPLKGHRVKAARLPRRGRVGMKAAAEAPATKVMAGAGDEADAADHETGKTEAKRPTAKGSKAAPKKAAVKGVKVESRKAGAQKVAAKKASPKAASKKAAAKKAEPSTKKADAGR